MVYQKGTLIKHRDGHTEVADGTTNYSNSAWSVVSGGDSGGSSGSSSGSNNGSRQLDNSGSGNVSSASTIAERIAAIKAEIERKKKQLERTQIQEQIDAVSAEIERKKKELAEAQAREARDTGSAAENAAEIAKNPPKASMLYKNSASYKALSEEAKSFIDLAYDTIQVGGEEEARQLSEAINNAIAIADPYYAAQLELAKGEIGAAIAGQNNDFERQHRILTQTRDRLAEDVKAESTNLTLEQQADISSVLRGFDEDILSIADAAAEKGLTFATGARSRALAETRRTEQMQDVVQSSRREYNYKINELRVKAARGDEDAANQLADLEKSNKLALEKIGRTAETVLGSANVPGITGYTPVGGVLGTIEENKRKSILSDVTGFMTLQQGFGI